MKRIDGRRSDELRPLIFTPDYVVHPEGSVLVAMGGTKVLCNVTVQPGVPRWKERQGVPGGWVTGEYALLPRATHQRTRRETNGLRARTQEIKRLIGRSLRAAVNLEHLGERTCIVDCDVIQADGGTRTASVTGGYVALALALNRMIEREEISQAVFLAPVAAISVGLVENVPLLDLCYEEDVRAEVDFNLVMNDAGEFIEVQGNAEGAPFSRDQLDALLTLAAGGIETILALQKQALSQSAS
jgi:ribonuclease PH